MGKIRVKSLGSEEEKEDKKQAKARAEAKRIEAMKKQGAEAKAASNAGDIEKKDATSDVANASGVDETVAVADAPVEAKKSKVKIKQSSDSKDKRSESYMKAVAALDKNKKYKLKEALQILPTLKRTKFDETVELHFNTTEKGISGNFNLPHGTGKQMKIVIANQSTDPKHVEELVKQIEAGKIDFDVLIATPDTMPKLARVARVLGPRGLMPNPKNGTVTPKPEVIAKQFEGGQVNFKTESKFPLLHISVGKVSFGEEKLSENIKVAVNAIQTKNIKKAVIKSTMSPAMQLDTASL
jgi:large subunit ribosomal protein L1